MKTTHLLIENFMGIGRAELDLADKGLVLIQGVNLDDTSANSNGAGKSSLADAISWVRYGETARGTAADEVVNNKVGKNTHVIETVTEDDGGFYTIQRWRKKAVGGKRAGCSLTYTDPSGSVADLTKGTDRLTQLEIDKALGCTKEVFVAAVYAGQEALPNLPAMTDLELKKLIEEASGVTTLVKAHEIARTKLRDAERASDSWRADHVRLENDVNTCNSRIADLKARIDGYEAKRKGEIATLNVDFTQAKDRARRAQLKRDDIVVDTVQKKIDACDAAINAVHEENEEESRLNLECTTANANYMTATSVYNRMVTQAHELRGDLDKVKDQVGKPCSTCGRPYEEHDLGAAKELAAEKLRIEVGRAKEQQKDANDLKKVAESAQDALQTFRASKTDIRTTVEERRRLALLLSDRNAAERDFEREVKDARRIKGEIDAKTAETNPYGPLIEKANEELADHMKAHRESEVLGVDLERRVQVCKDVVRVYGPAGVRAHILDTVTPYLNARTSDYLGAMSDGMITAVWSTITLNAKGEPTEKFAIQVEKANAGSSFAALSGGEKRKVRLACALALQDLVASRAMKPINLFIGDELDDALDDAGLERLMNVLEQKARERGTVLIISHNSLRDWVRECITFTMQDGLSSVEAGICSPAAPLAIAA